MCVFQCFARLCTAGATRSRCIQSAFSLLFFIFFIYFFSPSFGVQRQRSFEMMSTSAGLLAQVPVHGEWSFDGSSLPLRACG